VHWGHLLFYAALIGAVYFLAAPPSNGGRAAVTVSGSLSDILGESLSVSGAI